MNLPAEKPHEIRDHAELGGSTAERWVNCYGSVALLRKVPKGEATEAALKGTHAHEVAEKLVKEFLTYKETGDRDSKLLATLKVSQELLDDINDYIVTLWDKVLFNSITKKLWGVEDQFILDETLQMYGIIDFWCVYRDDSAKRAGVIVDFKYGTVLVPEKKNAQLAFYAVALRTYVRSLGKDLDYVRAAIYQPRAWEAEDAIYREIKFSAKQLDTWEAKFRKAAHAIYVQKNAKYKMGSWCKYCDAKAICPKYIKEIEKNTELALTNVNEVTFPAVNTLSDSQLFRLIKVRDVCIEWLDAVKAFAITRYLNGNPIPGTKVVESKPNRCWIDDEALIAKTLEAAGVDCWKKKLKGITEMEKIVEPSDLKPFITRGDPKPLLVMESDPRPGVTSKLDLLKENKDGTNG